MPDLQVLSCLTAQSSTPRKKRILIIDDSTDILVTNRTILETEDYEILTANSGPEALSILKHTSPLDLILLDKRMAGMSGSDFLGMLQTEHPLIFAKTPVVFQSALIGDLDDRAAGFIKKPIDIDEFIQLVRLHIEKGTSTSRLLH